VNEIIASAHGKRSDGNAMGGAVTLAAADQSRRSIA
jgi:hypothetical protein